MLRFIKIRILKLGINLKNNESIYFCKILNQKFVIIKRHFIN